MAGAQYQARGKMQCECDKEKNTSGEAQAWRLWGQCVPALSRKRADLTASLEMRRHCCGRHGVAEQRGPVASSALPGRLNRAFPALCRTALPGLAWQGPSTVQRGLRRTWKRSLPATAVVSAARLPGRYLRISSTTSCRQAGTQQAVGGASERGQHIAQMFRDTRDPASGASGQGGHVEIDESRQQRKGGILRLKGEQVLWRGMLITSRQIVTEKGRQVH